jgi:hypothetical protein
LTFNGIGVTVIGVLPAGFSFPTTRPRSGCGSDRLRNRWQTAECMCVRCWAA